MEMETGYVYMYICYFFHVDKEGPLLTFVITKSGLSYKWARVVFGSLLLGWG